MAKSDISPTAAYPAAAAGVDLAAICITSAGALRDGAAPEGAFTPPDVPGVAVRIAAGGGEKSQRCWKVLPGGGTVAAPPELWRRRGDAVGARADGPSRG